MTKSKVTSKKVAPKKSASPKTTKTVVSEVSRSLDINLGKKVVTTDTNGVGRRKSSVARVWIAKGSGAMTVNGRPANEYFNTAEDRHAIVKPLMVCAQEGNYTVKANVRGGGLCSQSDAVGLGLARALVEVNASFKAALKDEGLLTVDSRVKERKKPGQKAARRKFQFVKR